MFGKTLRKSPPLLVCSLLILNCMAQANHHCYGNAQGWVRGWALPNIIGPNTWSFKDFAMDAVNPTAGQVTVNFKLTSNVGTFTFYDGTTGTKTIDTIPAMDGYTDTARYIAQNINTDRFFGP